MPDDRERIVRLAEAVADRADVDWERESSSSGEASRRRIHNLHVVQQIQRIHSESPLAQSETEEAPPAPTSWGPFKHLTLLDSGGYGRVYRAHDEGLRTDVALKLLHRPAGGSSPERFLEEARKLARVRHPNVLTVHGVAIHDGVVGLWTELLEGVTLERRLETEGVLGANEAALVGIDLCRALSAVHGAGIVHRDIKTKNVMREKGGRIVLLDFSAGSERQSTSSSPAGTPLYMAPELFEGRDSGVAADLYALGVVLYRLVTGRFPVPARDLGDLQRAHLEHKRVPLLDARADLPAGFVRVVERALDPDPARRYASAGEMERELAAFVGSSPAVGSASGDRISLPRKPALLVASAVLIAVVAALVLLFGPSRSLRVEADWQRTRDGRTESLAPGTVLAEGECLRLALSPNLPVFAYVLNEDASGATTLLFPLSSLDVVNPLRGGGRHVLPGTVAGREECWRLGASGEETLLVIASVEPLTEFEAEIARLPRVDGSAAVTIPRGEWGRRLRGVVGLSSIEEAGPRLSDLSRAVSTEIARKAGLWTWEVRFRSGSGSASASVPPARALPESELERQERLLREEPENPRRLVDLARTLLRSGDDPGDLLDHARALELASQAFEIDPQSVDACETRAVGLERLFLRETAVEVWERCLVLDGDELLAERARVRLTRLKQQPSFEDWKTVEGRMHRALERGDADEIFQIARQFPEPTAALWEDELLPAWVADPRGPTSDGLGKLEIIARAMQETTGDRWFMAIVQPFRERLRSRDETGLAYLVQAHASCSTARSQRKAGDCESAERNARRSVEEFGGRSPYAMRAQFEGAVCEYQAGRFEDAEYRLSELGARAELAGYRLLQGESLWMRGLARSRQGGLGQGMAHYREAAAVFEASGLATHRFGIESLQAMNYDLLGSYRLGWTHRASVLAYMDRLDDSRRLHQALLAAALAASMQGFPRVAVDFERVGLATAQRRGDVVEIVNGSARLAGFLNTARRVDEALTVIDDARAWLAAHPSSNGPSLEAEVAAASGELLVSSRPAEAVAELDRAIRFFEEGRQARLAELYPLRGRAHWSLGDIERAEVDLRRGIDVFEEQREQVAEEFDPVTFADVSRRVYDTMVRFQLEARRVPDAALEFADRSRARQLRKQLGAQSYAPPVGEWSARTPDELTWLYYYLLDDRLLIWVGRAGRIDHVEIAVDARKLSASLTDLRRLLEQGHGRAETLPRLQALYDLLIAPVAGLIRGTNTLIVLPDGALNFAPFAALVDSKTGRYLAQDHSVAVSPAAGLLISRPGRGDVPHHGSFVDALIIGSPALDDTARSVLGSLDGAEAESRRIAEIYEQRTLLTGEAATRSRFLDSFGRTEVVHFAGHAVVDELHPELSRLYFASGTQPGQHGELMASDLTTVKAGRTRIVILAACETAGGRISATEGPIGLARSFLGIGVPAVVATLWRIEDAASVEFFTVLHQALRETGDAIAALNAAQRAAIEQGSAATSDPRVWAAAQLFIGYYNGDEKGDRT